MKTTPIFLSAALLIGMASSVSATVDAMTLLKGKDVPAPEHKASMFDTGELSGIPEENPEFKFKEWLKTQHPDTAKDLEKARAEWLASQKQGAQ